MCYFCVILYSFGLLLHIYKNNSNMLLLNERHAMSQKRDDQSQCVRGPCVITSCRNAAIVWLLALLPTHDSINTLWITI